MARSTGVRGEAQPSAVTLGRAIDRAMKQSPIGKQTALADALDLDQTTVSKMITGKIDVTVIRIAEIEQLCGLPRGQILAWAGFVAPVVEFPDADTVIEMEGRISKRQRDAAAEAARRVAQARAEPAMAARTGADRTAASRRRRVAGVEEGQDEP